MAFLFSYTDVLWFGREKFPAKFSHPLWQTAAGPFIFAISRVWLGGKEEISCAIEILPIRCGKPQPGLSILIVTIIYIILHLSIEDKELGIDIRRFSVGLWKGKVPHARQMFLSLGLTIVKIVILPEDVDAMSLKSANQVDTNRVELEVEVDAAAFEDAVNKAYEKNIRRGMFRSFPEGATSPPGI